MVKLTIFGEPASKANSRRVVKFGERSALIKSDKARSYEGSALLQIPLEARMRIDVPVRVSMTIYYATQRPDLDESLILDLLQDRYKGTGQARKLVQAGVYRNDRLVREKWIRHAIDKENPRAEISVVPLDGKLR